MRHAQLILSMVASTIAPLTFVRPAQATECTLVYNGGQLVSNPEAVAVFWGGSVDPQVIATMPPYFTTLLGSPYMDIFGEYSVFGADGGQRLGRGSFVGSYTISPSASGSTVDDSQLGPELAAQIAAHNLPSPTLDSAGLPRTIYFLFFPLGITITVQGSASCQQFCSYHNGVTVDGLALQYAVLPDQSTASACFRGCGTASSYIGNLEGAVSSELAQSLTDPVPGSGWYATGNFCGEVIDICKAAQAPLVGSSYVVEKAWSNREGACLAQPGCPATCAAPTPICDTFGSVGETCVACFTDFDCPQADCNVATCSAATQQCTSTPVADASPCDGGTCMSGVCQAPDAGTFGDAGTFPDGGTSSGTSSGGTVGSVTGGGPGTSIPGGHTSGCATGEGSLALLALAFGGTFARALGKRRGG